MTTHEVETAYEKSWSTLKNGRLSMTAEEEGFQVLVTTDLNLKYQQNLDKRTIAIVVLSTPSWPRIKEVAASVVSAVEAAQPGSYVEVKIP